MEYKDEGVIFDPSTNKFCYPSFVSHAHADRIGEQFYGPPDLVVEVLSPGTQHTDRGVKMLEYARAGVSEYWLVDPETRSIEVYTLGEGVYIPLGQFGAGQAVRSQVLSGVEVPVDEVFVESPG